MEKGLRIRVIKVVNMPINAAGKCIEEGGADVLISGCFSFIGLAAEMQEELGVPVIEPAGAVVRRP